jgi:signal recognition particle receptor subunit beta
MNHLQAVNRGPRGAGQGCGAAGAGAIVAAVMVQFNFNERTIKAKVVYYGPAQSGKTTNLEQIHSRSDPAGTSRLISLDTAQDRTLFFDLLPFSLGAVAGYDFKLQLYTIPGQVQYNATRRVVLAGADAVVFVADSRKSLLKENQAAFENMKVNLLANRLVPEKMSLVLQYNKRDLPDILTEDELSRALNPWGRPVFTAVASAGQGVMETFVAAVQEMLTAIAIKYNLKEKGLDPTAVPGIVSEAFAEVLSGAKARGRAGDVPPAAADGFALVGGDGLEFSGSSVVAEGEALPAGPPSARIVVSQFTDSLHAAPPPAAQEAGLVSEELLHRSIRSSVDLAEALAGLVRDMNVGLGTILSHAELLLLYKDEAREKRAGAIAAIQQEAARLRGLVQGLGTPAVVSVPHRATAPPPTEPVPGSFEEFLREVLATARPPLDALEISVDLRIPPGTLPPNCPPPTLHRALAETFEGLAGAMTPRSQVFVRCERKPVLFRGPEGEVKKDFLMLALAHNGTLSAVDQQRIVQGLDQGPLGQASRLFREMGGFVRFAPLPGGTLETRVFLPAN